MTVAAIIPAHDEAETVGAVVDVARRATTVDEVIVVDNASTDGTAEAARRRGARVIGCSTKGKGQAMATGVGATDAEYIVFLDADLLGLSPEHVDSLVAPILSGDAAMSLGLFDRGGELNPVFLNVLPKLTGQRAMHRDLFAQLDLEDIKGYKVEAALNSLCSDLDLPVTAFVCEGLWHRTKEEKDEVSALRGTVRKVAMLATATWSYVSYAVVRPVRDRIGLGGA